MEHARKIHSWGILLLAAGSSARLGRPKQLLPFSGTTLLRHAAATAASAGADAVLIILGANAASIRREIADMPVEVLIHERHEEGMASSLCAGLQHLLKADPGLDGVMIMVCDQPWVDAPHIRALMEKQDCSGAALVASVYENRKGVPAVFHKEVFSRLLQIKGDKGARDMIEKYGDQAETVPFPAGSIDIDTIQDYEALLTDPVKDPVTGPGAGHDTEHDRDGEG